MTLDSNVLLFLTEGKKPQKTKEKGVQASERKLAAPCLVAGRVWGWRRQGQGRRRGLVSWQHVFPTERVRYIYFCRALYFPLWRQFNGNPICLLKHLPRESFRTRKSWFIAVRSVDWQTSSPPSHPPALAAASRRAPHPPVPARSPSSPSEGPAWILPARDFPLPPAPGRVC